MDKVRDGVALVAAANASAGQGAPDDDSELLGVGVACLRVAVAVVVGYSFAFTAWRVRHDPRGLAFVAASALLLGALLLCLRRVGRLAPDSRRGGQAAVWALFTVLSFAVAYRVAGVMPPALAVLVWCMAAFVVLTGFFLLVLCKVQQGQAIHEADAAGDRNDYVKIGAGDELV